MRLRFGVRPFDFPDFARMIETGKFELNQVNYVDVVKSSLQNEFQHFEITSDLMFVLPGLLSPKVIQQLNHLKTENDYSCSVHCPLWSIELASPNTYIKQASIDCTIETIERTKALKPLCWVIHATGALVAELSQQKLPQIPKEFMMKRFSSFAFNSIERILDKTNIPSRKLAVENVEFPFRVMEEGLESLDLSVCLDTGHLITGFSGEWINGVIEFYESYQDRIVELHLHDAYRNSRKDHIPLGNCDLPVRELLINLIESNFSGPVVFELTLDEVKKSTDFIKINVPEVLS
ncbi:MAG: cobamide remodeling phosphodiesterase CbiR [Candidatus Hodarchaeota archaeon]